jgi:tetratricopeptide (TPR) repeat protein
MLKSTFAALVLLMSLHATLHACLNEHEETLIETPVPARLAPRDLKAEAPEIREKADQYLAEYKETNRMKEYQRYGVQLILLGKYEEAQKVFIRVSVSTDNWYSVAANLGTLNELRGEPEGAYHMIKRAIQINKNAHHGSEWIHLNILDVKRTPGRPASSKNLINTDFGTGVAPVTTLPVKRLEELSRHLRWQLNERMAFVHPNDSFVARLVFDLANVQVLLHEFDLARENYDWARKYGMTGELLDERVAYVDDAEDNARKAAEIDARAKAEAEKLKLEPRRTPEQEAAFWEQMGALSFSVVALLSIGIYFGIQRLRKKK